MGQKEGAAPKKFFFTDEKKHVLPLFNSQVTFSHHQTGCFYDLERFDVMVDNEPGAVGTILMLRCLVDSSR